MYLTIQQPNHSNQPTAQPTPPSNNSTIQHIFLLRSIPVLLYLVHIYTSKYITKSHCVFFDRRGVFAPGLPRRSRRRSARPAGNRTGARPPWLERRVLKVEIIDLVSWVTPPAPPRRAGYVKNPLGDKVVLKKNKVSQSGAVSL